MVQVDFHSCQTVLIEPIKALFSLQFDLGLSHSVPALDNDDAQAGSHVSSTSDPHLAELRQLD